MTCEHVTALLHDYLAHTLSSEERTGVVQHITHCPSCARLACEYELIVRAAQTLTPPPPPSDVEQRLRETLAKVIREHADQPGVMPMPPE